MAAPLRSMRLCLFRNKHNLHCGSLHMALCKIIRRETSDLVVNHKVVLDSAVQLMVQNGEVKHRKHPGLVTVKKVMLPDSLQEAVTALVERFPIEKLPKKALQLNQFLWSRHLPIENDDLTAIAEQFEAEIIAKDKIDIDSLDEAEKEQAGVRVQAKVLNKLKKRVYHWQPMKYNAFRSFLYLMGRMAQDYSVMYQIFSEMQQRLPTFKPSALFDLGSGVGSSMWAANHVWKKSLTEHYCVDPSGDMNTIARLLLQDGEEEQDMSLPGVYFRQFFPASAKSKYSLVTSAFTLMEFQNQAERLNKILELWKKTDEFLIIVENGTNAGFKIINEARDFILQLQDECMTNCDSEEDLRGHVFAPCPHHFACPRHLRQDGTPCNFEVCYQPFTQMEVKNKKETSRYSYVVFRKGQIEEDPRWSRVVKPTAKLTRRVNLRTCSAAGRLEYTVITTAKHGKDLYWCSRACQWGDQLPVTVATTADTSCDDNNSASPMAEPSDETPGPQYRLPEGTDKECTKESPLSTTVS